MGFVLGAQFPQCLCILLARQVLVLPVERGQGQSRYNGSAGGEIFLSDVCGSHYLFASWFCLLLMLLINTYDFLIKYFAM